MFFGVSRSVTECFQSVTDYLQPVTELGTPKNMAVVLPGMTLQPLYKCCFEGVKFLDTGLLYRNELSVLETPSQHVLPVP